jgi:nucleoside-diphosphate-sugar epimerase
MRKKVILITGAAGEIGQALVEQLSESQSLALVTIDLAAMPPDLQERCTHFQGNILDEQFFGRMVSEYEFETIYHLAALLSTRSEFTPALAHQVNVNGTINLLNLAAEQSQWRRKPVQFIFPSSIAIYGLPDLDTKAKQPPLREWDWNYPTTMYGCTKLYCEQLGAYFSKSFRQLAEDNPIKLDFRSVRFPGLISASTIPSGGTSDYGPEMLHAAAQGEDYDCFVRPDTVIPFMVMPDAIKSLLLLAQVPAESLRHHAYNVTSFSLTAAQFRERVMDAFPQANISFEPDVKRQGIVDTWPAALNDSAAREDWNWAPEYDVDRSFDEYLVPSIQQRYLA